MTWLEKRKGQWVMRDEKSEWVMSKEHPGYLEEDDKVYLLASKIYERFWGFVFMDLAHQSLADQLLNIDNWRINVMLFQRKSFSRKYALQKTPHDIWDYYEQKSFYLSIVFLTIGWMVLGISVEASENFNKEPFMMMLTAAITQLALLVVVIVSVVIVVKTVEWFD